MTLRHVGFRSRAQLELHDALWRYWFGRLVDATEVEPEVATEIIPAQR
jgi:hypothetical protein